MSTRLSLSRYTRQRHEGEFWLQAAAKDDEVSLVLPSADLVDAILGTSPYALASPRAAVVRAVVEEDLILVWLFVARLQTTEFAEWLQPNGVVVRDMVRAARFCDTLLSETWLPLPGTRGAGLRKSEDVALLDSFDLVVIACDLMSAVLYPRQRPHACLGVSGGLLPSGLLWKDLCIHSTHRTSVWPACSFLKRGWYIRLRTLCEAPDFKAFTAFSLTMV